MSWDWPQFLHLILVTVWPLRILRTRIRSRSYLLTELNKSDERLLLSKWPVLQLHCLSRSYKVFFFGFVPLALRSYKTFVEYQFVAHWVACGRHVRMLSVQNVSIVNSRHKLVQTICMSVRVHFIRPMFRYIYYFAYFSSLKCKLCSWKYIAKGQPILYQVFFLKL